MIAMEKKFYILGSFEYAIDVQIVKGKLESEGIPVFIQNENTLNSENPRGGVKLQVYSKDKERAVEIYNEIRAYAIDNDGNPIICPNCRAQKSETYFERKGLFYKLFPFFEKRKYKCLNCGIITKPE